jgi:hypothetical protein
MRVSAPGSASGEILTNTSTTREHETSGTTGTFGTIFSYYDSKAETKTTVHKQAEWRKNLAAAGESRYMK